MALVSKWLVRCNGNSDFIRSTCMGREGTLGEKLHRDDLLFFSPFLFSVFLSILVWWLCVLWEAETRCPLRLAKARNVQFRRPDGSQYEQKSIGKQIWVIVSQLMGYQRRMLQVKSHPTAASSRSLFRMSQSLAERSLRRPLSDRSSQESMRF